MIEYSYAARAGCVETSQGKIFWNNKLIEEIIPKDELIHVGKLEVTAEAGDNIFEIEGSGTSDSYGLTVTGFKLYEIS